MRKSQYLAPLLALLLLAFFLRVYRLPSVPFGWHPDEATKGLLARDVLNGKYHPVFFSAFTGRDALYVYLEAGFFALFGEGMFAGRLLSASIGLLTVAATYRIGGELFNRRVGMLAAALLTVSLWHLIASRNGYRAVIQPLVQLPALGLLFRGLRHTGNETRRDLAVAGLFLGLTQYTYTAARFFPLLIAAILLTALLLSPPLVVRRLRAVAAMLLIAGAVFAPLGVHFYNHPGDLFGRAAQISVFNPTWAGGNPWGRLWQSVRETAGMFTVRGDPNFRFNLAGRPVFGLPDGAAFYGGLLLALRCAVRGKAKTTHRLACATLLLWPGIMLLPMTFSAEGLPYFQRAIGTLPAVFLLPALALDAAVTWAARKRPPLHHLGNILLTLLIAYLTVQTSGEYFHAWHTNRRNDDDRRVAMVYAADYLKHTEPVGELYLSSEYAEHPTLAFLTPERYDGIHWFDARQSLPLPPPGLQATYLLLLETPPQPWLMSKTPGLHLVQTGFDRFARPVFEIYRRPGDAPPVEPTDRSPATWSWEVTFEPGDPAGLRHTIPLPVNFGDTLNFLGHDRNTDTVSPGGTLELILYWKILRRPTRNYSFFAHLLSPAGQVVGEYDANRYGTKFWLDGGGETLLNYFPLRLQPDTPPGEYQLEIGVYHRPTGERLPIYEKGTMVADRLLLRPVTVK